ncbi:MAG: Dephospho-CoA kinase [Pseudomonadota bacterium]|jgi:dephospho-CoA kinase
MNASNTLRIGLTGGIGSGKSTVSAMLSNMGAVVIDADAISRQLTARGGAALPAIAQAFGAQMIDGDGAMDRQAMRTLVFANPGARQQLEAIIHPLVTQTIRQQARAAADAGARMVVLDIPLLVEAGDRWRKEVDKILVVDCSEETQIERVMQRSGLQREEVQRIIAQQASRQQRAQMADVLLLNEGMDMTALQAEVEKVARQFGL